MLHLKIKVVKDIRFNITKRFKSGGEVEVGKGKDYIKDLI
jgi:hypothetical protein